LLEGIEELCKNNIIAKASAEDMEPHWTTIVGFISGNGDGFKGVFIKALAYCSELQLVEGGIFAVDGGRMNRKQRIRKPKGIFRKDKKIEQANFENLPIKNFSFCLQ
jgi:hypothetical protein